MECIWPEWSQWTEWTNNCNVDIGEGRRRRSCSVKLPNPGCPGETTETRECIDQCSDYGCSDICQQPDNVPICSCRRDKVLALDNKTCESYHCPGVSLIQNSKFNTSIIYSWRHLILLCGTSKIVQNQELLTK